MQLSAEIRRSIRKDPLVCFLGLIAALSVATGATQASGTWART